MFPNNFYMPNGINYSVPIFANGIRNIPPINGVSNLSRGGLLSRLGGGMSFFRRINWSSLFNNASRTLGVINQAIPIVKQTGPMINNMKSMLRLASAFKDETDKDIKSTNTNNNISNNNNTNDNKKEVDDNNSSNVSPNFFVS